VEPGRQRPRYSEVARLLAREIAGKPIDQRDWMVLQVLVFARKEFGGDPEFRFSAFRNEFEEVLGELVTDASASGRE